MLSVGQLIKTSPTQGLSNKIVQDLIVSIQLITGLLVTAAIGNELNEL